MQDELLTMDEVAAQYPVPIATLRFYRHRGDIGPRSFKLGRRVVYKRSDVDAWVEEKYANNRVGAA